MEPRKPDDSPAPVNEPSVRRYDFDAFISYRRVDGTPAALWLVRKLRNYKLPKSLAPGRTPLRLYIDRTYACANEDFWKQNVEPALSRSRFLLLIATQALNEYQEGSDKWVEKEIAAFERDLNGRGFLFARANGRLDDPLPESLHHYGNPHIVDLRPASSWQGRLRERGRLHQEFLGLIAPLYDIDPQHMPLLRQEDERRRRRNVWFGSSAAVAVASVILLLSLFLVFTRIASESKDARNGMVFAQEAWRSRRTAELVQSLATVVASAPRRDSLRTSAMAALIANLPGMPQMVADLGPVTAATMSVDRGIVIARRLNGSWVVRDVVHSAGLPGPDISRLDEVKLSFDGRFAAGISRIPGSSIAPSRLRLVLWAVGSTALLADETYSNAGIDFDWSTQGLLLVRISNPAQLLVWKFDDSAGEQVFSIPGRFSTPAPSNGSTVVVRVLNKQLTELDVSQLKREHPQATVLWNTTLPADVPEWAVISWHVTGEFDFVLPAPPDPSGLPGFPGNPTPTYHCGTRRCVPIDSGHEHYISSEPPWLELDVSPPLSATEGFRRFTLLPRIAVNSEDALSEELRELFDTIEWWRQGPSDGSLLAVSLTGDVREWNLHASMAPPWRGTHFAPVATAGKHDGTELWMISSDGQILRFLSMMPQGGASLFQNGSVLESCADPVGSSVLWAVQNAARDMTTVFLAGAHDSRPKQIFNAGAALSGRCSSDGSAMLLELPPALGTNDLPRLAAISREKAESFTLADKNQHPWRFAWNRQTHRNQVLLTSGLVAGLQNERLIPECVIQPASFKSFSRDGESFLLRTAEGFSIRSSVGPNCAGLVTLPLATNDSDAIEAISVAYSSATQRPRSDRGSIEFQFGNGAWVIRETSATFEIESERGVALALPRLPDEETPQKYVALSRDGFRLVTRNLFISETTSAPDKSKYDLECYNVWDIRNAVAVRLSGPFCSGRSFGGGQAHAYLSEDGSELHIQTAGGELVDVYVGPSGKPATWNWLTAGSLSSLENFETDRDGRLTSRFGTAPQVYSRMHRQLLRDAAGGDRTADRFARILTSWCGNGGCR